MRHVAAESHAKLERERDDAKREVLALHRQLSTERRTFRARSARGGGFGIAARRLDRYGDGFRKWACQSCRSFQRGFYRSSSPSCRWPSNWNQTLMPLTNRSRLAVGTLRNRASVASFTSRIRVMAVAKVRNHAAIRPTATLEAYSEWGSIHRESEFGCDPLALVVHAANITWLDAHVHWAHDVHVAAELGPRRLVDRFGLGVEQRRRATPAVAVAC